MFSFAKSKAFQKAAALALAYCIVTWQLGFKEGLIWFAAMAAGITPFLVGALLSQQLLRSNSVPQSELIKWTAVFCGSIALLWALGSFSLIASRWALLVFSFAMGIALGAYSFLIARKKS